MRTRIAAVTVFFLILVGFSFPFVTQVYNGSASPAKAEISSPPHAALTSGGSNLAAAAAGLAGSVDQLTPAALQQIGGSSSIETQQPKVVQTSGADYEIAPHEVNVSGGYRYVSPQGNLTFSDSNAKFSYTNLSGKTSVKQSEVVVKFGSTYSTPVVPATYHISQASFSESYQLMSAGQNCGVMNVSLNMSSWNMSFDFASAGNCGNYNIFWLLVGSGNYCSTSPSGAQTYANSTSTLPSLGNVTQGYLAPDSSGKGALTTIDMSDYGSADFRCGTMTIGGTTLHGAAVIFPLNVADIDPTIVQDPFNQCGDGWGCEYDMITTATSGDFFVVPFFGIITGTASSCIPGIFSILASTGASALSWTFLGGAGESGASNTGNAYAWYSSTVSATLYNITITQTGHGASGTCPGSPEYEAFGLYEISNGATPTAATGSGSGITFTTSSSIGASGDLAIGSVGRPVSSSTCWTHGSGFSTTFPGWAYFSEVDTSLSGSTNFPASVPMGCSSFAWAEVGVDIPGVVTVPISLSIQNSATKDSASVSCTGGGGSYTTSAGTQDFACQSNVTVTVALAAGGANNQWCFSGECTSSESFTSCSSGTCSTASYNYYEQFKNTFTESLSVGTFASGLTWTYTGYQSGSSGQTICTSSPSSGGTSANCTGWSDYNQAATAPAAPSGEATNERFENSVGSSSTAGTPTTGGNTYSTSYYRQEGDTISYALLGGGSPTAPTFTYTTFGTSGTTYTMTTSGVTKWLDYGTGWTISPNPLTGSGASERWQTSSSLSGTATTGGTIDPSFYHQYKQSVAYSIATCDSGATCSSAPTLYYDQFGSATMSTLSTTAGSYWIDAGTITYVSASITDSLSDSYTPSMSYWLINGVNVVNSPVEYWCGL